ncbi:MAG TPA: MATE family efflux transporter [Rubrivivax sp.]|nr:MATE family efflux transporter [Rubrivivax sp.]
MSRSALVDSARRIAPLAWPVLVGQLSVLAFATIDTVLVARTSAQDLAALAVGGAAFITVFIGFMGVVLALSPIVGQLFGAGKLREVGRETHQAVWLALGLSVIGSALLAYPAPFLALAKAGPEVADKVRGYLTALAFSLPGSLLFTVYRALNTAVSRPKAVMLLQMGALAIKVPLSTALVFGVPAIGLPALGVTGCGIATAAAVWSQVIAASIVLRRDPFYARFHLLGHGLHRPDWKAMRQQLRLGIPMGAAILIEVTAFSFMALFIARLGATPVAGHQIAVNLVSMMFMMPLALGNATSTLVAQSVGAGAHTEARRLGRHGLMFGCGLAALLGAAVYLSREVVVGLYTHDATIIAAALPLMAWLVVFHIADAAQTVAAFVLRAFKIATVPMVIYVAALWGVGLGGGYLLAFNVSGTVPAALQGARGYWMASTLGLVLAGTALSGFMFFVFAQLRREQPRQPAPHRTSGAAGGGPVENG